MKYLLSLCLFILFLGISLFLFLSQKPLCVSSTELQRLSLIGQTSTFHVFNCSFNKKVIYSDSINKLIIKADKDINSVSNFFANYDNKVFHFSLNVLSDRKKYIFKKNDQIYISLDLFNSEHFFKEYLLEQVIQSKFESSKRFSEKELKIIGSLLKNVFFADKINSFENKSVWPLLSYGQESLYQFFNDIVWESYLKLTLFDRNQLISNIFRQSSSGQILNFNEKSYSLEILGQTDITANKNQSLIELNDKKTILDSVDFINKITNQGESHFFSNYIIETLLAYDFNFSKVDQFDYFISLNSVNDLAFLKGVNNSDIKYIFANKNIYFDKSGIFIDEINRPVKILNIVADYFIYFDCNNDNFINYKNLSTQRIVAIKTCDLGSVNFKNLKKGSLSLFLKDNSNLPLVVYYVPAIEELKLDNKKLNELTDWIKDPVRNSNNLKFIGWQAPIWDNKLMLFRTNATHDVIEYFRF